MQNNYINEENMDDLSLSEYKEQVYSTSFQYHNFLFVPDDINQQIFFFLACEFDYLNIVKYFIETKQIDINTKIIFNIKFQNKVLIK